MARIVNTTTSEQEQKKFGAYLFTIPQVPTSTPEGASEGWGPITTWVFSWNGAVYMCVPMCMITLMATVFNFLGTAQCLQNLTDISIIHGNISSNSGRTDASIWHIRATHRNQKPKRHEIRGREHVVHSTHINSCVSFKVVRLLFPFGGKFLDFFDKPS